MPPLRSWRRTNRKLAREPRMMRPPRGGSSVLTLPRRRSVDSAAQVSSPHTTSSSGIGTRSLPCRMRRNWAFRPEPRSVGYARLERAQPGHRSPHLRPQRTRCLAAIPPDIGTASGLPLQNPVLGHLAGGEHPQSSIRASRCPRLYRVVKAALAVGGWLTAVGAHRRRGPDDGKQSWRGTFFQLMPAGRY